jgi:hypothetical protein
LIGRTTDAARVALREAGTLNNTKGVPTMARFMDIHYGFVGVTEQELAAAHDADLANEKSEGVHFEKAWLDDASGKVFCLSTGPSKEAVQRVHDRAGHPAAEVYEITAEV